LHEALRIVTLCMAPFTPFITERIWQDLIRSTDANAPDSVHLAPWPSVDQQLVDPQLVAQMALVRRVVELGRAARAASSVRTRQPLSRALVSAPGWAELPAELVAEVAEELNVRSLDSLGEEAGLVDVSVKPNFRALGGRFGKATPSIAAAITAADAASLVEGVRTSGSALVSVDGESIEITPEDIIVTETPREGWSVASDGEESVAIDLHIDDELRRAGVAREIVRAIQEARKGAGLQITDRITVEWDSEDPDIVAAFDVHGSEIAGEVLAVSMTGAGSSSSDRGSDHQVASELPVTMSIRRAPGTDAVS
jgi:isoleucyl-tRNA synthetase